MPSGTPDKCKPAPGFCGGKANGLWCDGDKLVNCKNGSVTSSNKCAHGCQSMPKGQNDKCKPAPGFCGGKQNGAWCDGAKLVVCKDGAVASSKTCPDGCQSNPPGVADACKAAAGFCGSKQNGLWCDGNKLVNCSGGKVTSSQTCANGCQSNPPGVPDQCKAGGGGFCNGKQNGLWCNGNELVNCSNGKATSSSTCTAGCITMPSGVPDKCNIPGGSGKLVLCEPFNPKKPVTCGYGCYGGHKGADYAAGNMTPLRAPVGGKVVGLVKSYTGQTCKPDFGNYVKIATGPWEVFMAHMHKDIAVQKGGEVKAGQYIGMVSNTGYTLTKKNGIWVCQQGGGHHLHLEVRKNGVAVNPFGHPDVVWSSDCKGGTPPPTGFCTGKANGDWCDGAKLVTCKDGNKASSKSCSEGCQSMPQGVPDQCKKAAPAGFCSGKSNGKWCDGAKLITCKSKKLAAQTTCQHGCKSNAAGVPDQCKDPPPTGFCAGKPDGKWCDGNKLASCKGAKLLATQGCAHGCVDGACKPAPDVCAGKSDGTHCKGNRALTCGGGKTTAKKDCANGCGEAGGGSGCIQPPPQNFCTGKADGPWCAGNTLVHCKGSKVAKQSDCAWGCTGKADGAAGSCADKPQQSDPCLVKSDGGYCQAASHLVCKDGKTTLSEVCANGCVKVEGVATCADPPSGDFCDGKVSGMWCQGVKLVTCKGGKTQAAALCPYGCVAAAADQPDHCKPPGADACVGKADGAWCADALLIYCAGGVVGSNTFCAKGCQATGPGQSGACVDGAGFCGDKINGLWCSGNLLVQCLGGKEVATQTCTNGCTSQPQPLTDQCTEPSTWCKDKADGDWCDQGFLVQCQGGAETGRALCGFGCEGEAGSAACVPVGSGACTGLAAGTTCKDHVLISCEAGKVAGSITCLNGCAQSAEGPAGCVVPQALPGGTLEVRPGDACATLKGSLQLPVPVQNQLEFDVPLGACTGLTIASDGALITSMSMTYAWLNLDRVVLGVSGNTPPLENAWRNDHDGYQLCAGGQGQCCARWDRNPGKVGFQYLPLDPPGCMSVDIATRVVTALNALQPVIAAVHWGGGPEMRHWVTIVGADDGVLLVHDPYTGRSAIPLDKGELGSYVIDALFVPYLAGDEAASGPAPIIDGDGQPVLSTDVPGGLNLLEGEQSHGKPPVGAAVGSSGSSCSMASRSTPPIALLLLLGLALLAVRRRRA